MGFRKRVFALNPARDVFRDPHDADGSACGVPHGEGPGVEPSQGAVGPHDAVLHFRRPALLGTGQDTGHELAVLREHRSSPTMTPFCGPSKGVERGPRSRSGILSEARKSERAPQRSLTS